MSLVSVKTYFRARMNSLGYTEWTDGFNFENVPQTILNRSYHLQIGTISSGKANQTVHRFNYPMTIKVVFKGYSDPAKTIDDAVQAGEDILADVLSIQNRLGVEIKDVSPSTMTITEFDATNDNDIILTLDFNADIICNFT